MDFLGYRALRNLLSALGRSAFGSHDTPHLATGWEPAIPLEQTLSDVLDDWRGRSR